MKRFFGRGLKKKKKLSPSARTPEGMVASHPMYQYARKEFAQTVAPATSNDAGLVTGYNEQLPDIEETSNSKRDSSDSEGEDKVNSPTSASASDQNPPLSTTSPCVPPSDSGLGTHHDSYRPLSPSADSVSLRGGAIPHHDIFPPRQPLVEPAMPDATYEEYYGDAYVGGHIRYIYPSGYQSMRPRGGPWKLSIAICISFTWLSVFIIGHCSDRVDMSAYENEIDDDTLVIETRWCGSRLLYLMWVISMLITGLATAYCSVIGYIKVRDFAVANGRSQPPGMVGKSDYYVKIEDHGFHASESDSAGSSSYYQKTIYQADGTPQFWGGHIYRPTQAAVAITNR